MKIIKIIIRTIFELCAIFYPYVIFLKLINASDKITIINYIGMIVYSIIAIKLFEWSFETEEKVKEEKHEN